MTTLSLARQLIACRSLTPDGGGSIELVTARLADARFTCERIDRGAVQNLWAHHGSGRPLVCLAGHLDVVPPGPLEAWTTDPFTPAERDGNLYGRGAADMKVSVVEVDEPTFVQGRAIRVSIFMNVFNVHVNRYPVSGVVRLVEHKSGKFLNAAVERASMENEQASVGIEAGSNRILVRQIAGLIARRIITDAKDGDRVTQGDRMGLIRFGSRVDVFLPTNSKVRVKAGDITFAGVTVIGELTAQ